MTELDPTHQAVAEAARIRIAQLFSQSRVFAAEVILGTVSEDES